MNSRNKLNIAYFNGSVALAGLVGLLVDSWSIFAVALVVLVIGNVFTGDIRPKGKG